MMPNDSSLRPASSALTPTSGFLAGFTHTLQPYIGCRFGCEYCYVKGLAVHRFHRPQQEWGTYFHPRIGIAEKLNKELMQADEKGFLSRLAIFMSSATDPYQLLERRWRLSRACLDEMIQRQPGLLIIQTRSPFVQDDFERIAALGDQVWLNITLETDLDWVRKQVSPFAPSVSQRLKTLAAAKEMGLPVQITVSPCLPYSALDSFGSLLLAYGKRIIVDTYSSGDGKDGSRTRATRIPQLYEQNHWGVWQSEENALQLFHWLRQRIGERVGWSQEGFTALTNRMT